MDPEIRDAIKKRMLSIMDDVWSTTTPNMEAAKVLIEMERTSDIKTMEKSLELLKSELEALKRG